MTREEVKHIVDVAFDVPLVVRRIGEDRTYLEDEIREAKNMAIQALEQEPCEDCISRQAVEKITWEEPSYADALNVLTEVRDKVRALPSVNPQTKTGHWIRQDNTKEPLYGWYFCSECNSVIGDMPKFCSNCGARMESEG